jgi:hypothetical protein
VNRLRASGLAPRSGSAAAVPEQPAGQAIVTVALAARSLPLIGMKTCDRACS